MITIGQLREKVTLQSPAPLDDGAGNTTSGWASEFQVYARLQPKTGGEEVLAARLGGRQVYLVHVRSTSQTRQIVPEWRLLRGDGSPLQVKSPLRNMDEKNHYLEFDAEFGSAA